MSYRFLASTAVMAFLAASLQAQNKGIPKTPDGHPDLQGVWTNATITPLERPKPFAEKPTLSDDEAVAYEKAQAKELNDQDGQSDGPLIAAAGSSGTGGYNVLFIDRGSELARVDGVKRTSLIIDPPDGRIPPMTAEGRQRIQAMMQSFNRFENIKARPLAERCLLGFGSTAGPPMLPVEMVHDVRVIRMNQKHVPSDVRKWLGDSVGRWEGDTLVVDTTNFNSHVRFRGSSENLHVIERFQRVNADTILYRATIDDPTTFSKQFSLEYPFLSTPGPVYEYACHEGNYSMQDILGGARKMESEQAK